MLNKELLLIPSGGGGNSFEGFEIKLAGRGGSGCCERINFKILYNGTDISVKCTSVTARSYWVRFDGAASYDTTFEATPYNSEKDQFEMDFAKNCNTSCSAAVSGAKVRRTLTVRFTYQGKQWQESVLYHNY